MTEIKFTCTACGQHIQCDASHAGENFPCPCCAQLIRVPMDSLLMEVPVTEIPALLEDAEKASYAPVAKEHDGADKVSVSVEKNGESKTSASEPQPTIEAKAELHCVCPVCQAELRISLEAKSNGPNTETHHEHLTLEEREQQIAAAREAHPVSLYPPLKPRLDLLGEEAPADSGQHGKG